MFRRIAIINRGEAAMRLIHAVREINAAGGDGLTTIALHTEAERGAMFVREADEAERIGAERPGGGPARSPYLDHGELERAMRRVGADAAWVGWGFVAEDPAFAELCVRLGVEWIGPDPGVMRRLGDKIQAKRLAEQAGVPVARWSGGPVRTLAEARSQAERIGFPLMVKAAAGGGGRGIRTANGPGELAEAFERAGSEGRAAFGDPTVFMEQLMTGVRHVEVQIIGDHHGTVWAAGVRDCSVQRHHQKLIEESASTALSPEQDRQLRAAAVTLAERAGYRNAGTVEFLYQPASGTFAFLEVNARLQVEHPVTEMTTGLDLVKLQLHVAREGRLVGEPPAPRGHAMEARLNAEDPDRGFVPAPGRVEVLALPTGPGIRVDTGIAEGDLIPPEFDSMLAKVIAWGTDRDEARARLQRALTQTRVVVQGGTTNKAFLLDLLERPEMRTGRVDTTWLDRLVADRSDEAPPGAAVALAAAAIEAYDSALAIRRANFYAAAVRGRPEASVPTGEVSELRYRGRTYRLAVGRTGPDRYRVSATAQPAGGQSYEGEPADGQPGGGQPYEGEPADGRTVLDARLERLSPFERRLTVAGRRYRLLVQRQATEYLVEVDGVSHRVALDDGGMVRAPASGVVVVVAVAVGDVVAAGDTVAVVESMKMEVSVAAPAGGRVREVCASANVQVAAGAPLVRLEGPGDGSAATAGGAVRLGDLAGGPVPVAGRERCAAALETLRCSILGFEWSRADVHQVVEDYRAVRASLSAADDVMLLDAELHLMTVFADLVVLWRNRRGGEGPGDEEAHGAGEYLNAYLRSLDVEREGLPAAFRERLQRALVHYGVDDLARSPQLEDSLYWAFHAQQRAPAQLETVLTLLDHRIDAEALEDGLREKLRGTLDRLIVATQLRYPDIGELARSIRYRWFDQGVIQRAAEATQAEMRTHLALLDRARPGERQVHLDALVASTQPLVGLLVERGDLDGMGLEPMLEVLTRRYYKIRALDHVRPFRLDGRGFVTADYPRPGRTVHVIVTHGTVSAFDDAISAALALARDLPPGDTAVIDLYISCIEVPADPGALGAGLQAALNRSGAPPAVTRVAVSLFADAGRRRGDAAPTVTHLTYLQGHGGFTEDLVVRGLHPMIARRLQLWRLANFTIDPLRSPEGCYLFHCVARDNPADERFVAVAEVRDLTPVRDQGGRIAALPELEHTLAACLEGLRRAQADRAPARRLYWNRVLLHVWAHLEVPVNELLPMAAKLAPLTAGLGLEAVVVQGWFPMSPGGPVTEHALRLSYQPGTGLTIRITDPPTAPMRPLDAYTQKVIQARRRGLVYPYELIPLLTRSPEPAPSSDTDADAEPEADADAGAGGRAAHLPYGTFTEYDLDAEDRLVAVERPPGANRAGLVTGVLRVPTERYPEGMVRVVLLGDPTMALGAIAEPECRLIIAAIDTAERLGAPVEWFALSAGAKIAMDSGTENMDWVARVLRRLVLFTQGGGEVNVVVAGINVGAQPYWNAEATMLMHTRGILVMTPDSAMVLTGKQALEYSGGVSAEDNAGIGGYQRIMGPNGQAQYWAADLAGACDILMTHYRYSYTAPGERFPRPAVTTDPVERDVTVSPHRVEGVDFERIGDIFSERTNPGRKKPFDIRTLMRATLDRDHPPIERWAAMGEADNVVVLDGCLGGYAVTLLGTESRPLARFGPVPADGPDQWTAGTLFPLSAKKMARALNGASGSRPVVILANLSGFDGSPESLRRLQLEYGAEIGRAVVNFDGPIVFCVVSRYHGGAFVVFSGALNDAMEVAAVQGAHASVIGGAPAAAVVFAGEVNSRTRSDPRVRQLEARVAAGSEGQQARLRGELAEVRQAVRLEHQGRVAAEFDATHTVERAQRVGSVHHIVPAHRLRPYLVDAVRRGMDRAGPRRTAAPGERPPADRRR